MGIPSYWIFDDRAASLLVLFLQDWVYDEIAHVTGDELMTVIQPFPVTVVPNALVRV